MTTDPPWSAFTSVRFGASRPRPHHLVSASSKRTQEPSKSPTDSENWAPAVNGRVCASVSTRWTVWSTAYSCTSVEPFGNAADCDDSTTYAVTASPFASASWAYCTRSRSCVCRDSLTSVRSSDGSSAGTPAATRLAAPAPWSVRAVTRKPYSAPVVSEGIVTSVASPATVTFVWLCGTTPLYCSTTCR